MLSVVNEWLLIELTAEILHGLYRSRELQMVMSSRATIYITVSTNHYKTKTTSIISAIFLLYLMQQINYIDG
jgi:hypothetical protein